MDIYGLQKVTLLDFPGNVACTVFLGGCDFCCPFCHNMELVKKTVVPLMSDTEFFQFLQSRKGKLDGVAISGGEPCVNHELPAFIKRIHDCGFKVKLDTNGMHPKLLKTLLDEQLLDYVAMDIKNGPADYAATCGVGFVNFDAIKDSVRMLMTSGVDYEFRTTVVKEFHNAASFKDICSLIAGAKRYYLQPFVDRDTVPCRTLHAPPREELTAYLTICRTAIPNTKIRGVLDN